MLRGCLSFEPKNETVLTAIRELETVGASMIAESGIIRAGTATSLSAVGCCVHCQEAMGALEECIQFRCGHTFHHDCTIKWWQHQAQNDPLVQHAGTSGGDHEKLTCPLCRVKVVT